MPFADHPTRTVRANGQRIHLHIAGADGPLVLLCHGFPESAFSWRHQLDALAAAGYRAVAMDMRGYGRSSKPSDPGAYSVLDLVGDCVGVVEALGEEAAVIVGHDFGAPVAWTAAWTRPDVFPAVVGLGMPFGGRGLAALPGDPFGSVRPSEHHRALAGPDHVFYQDYFSQPGEVALSEIEKDLRAWLISTMYTLSADAPRPPELDAVNLMALPEELVVAIVRASMCIPHGESFAARLLLPESLPAWLPQSDLDFMVAELEQTGLRAPLAWYGHADADWAALADHADQPLTVPALFIAGDRDITSVWSQEAAARAHERVTDLRGSVIIEDCGHWMQIEKPESVNEELLTFLQSL